MRKILFAVLAISALALLSFAMKPSKGKSIHTFTVEDIDGNKVKLDKYKGKVLLIVNVASKCGLTPQYEELQTLYKEMEGKDFEILGFPANNFMGQEPGSNSTIKEFCTSKFQVTFPMFAKISVKGKNIHPLYKFLTTKKENKVLDAPVAWNFQKFLIDKQGNVVKSFSPKTHVTEAEVKDAIKALL